MSYPVSHIVLYIFHWSTATLDKQSQLKAMKYVHYCCMLALLCTAPLFSSVHCVESCCTMHNSLSVFLLFLSLSCFCFAHVLWNFSYPHHRCITFFGLLVSLCHFSTRSTESSREISRSIICAMKVS